MRKVVLSNLGVECILQILCTPQVVLTFEYSDFKIFLNMASWNSIEL